MVALTAKQILIVLPHQGYNAEEFRTTWVSLRRCGFDCKVASTSTEKAVGGIDYFFTDLTLDKVLPDEFAGVVFIGGEGAKSLFENPRALEIARKISEKGGLVGGIGEGAVIAAKTGLLKGEKATGDPSSKNLLEQLGARYTGGQVEPSWLRKNPKMVVTALDAGAALKFGFRIAKDLGV